MMNETLYQLIKSVQSSYSAPQVYGRIRGKLVKQGWSEFALYQQVANHCEENFIDPSTMVEEMKELLNGCSRGVNFLNNSNIFPFLRGTAQYHSLRHGDLETGGVKSFEQRGRAICNMCYNLKDKGEMSSHKNSKNSCAVCVKAQAKEQAEKVKKATIAKRERTEIRDKAKEAGEATPFEQGITAHNERVLSSKPVPEQIAPVVEEVHPEVHTGGLVLSHDNVNIEPVAQLHEVIADSEGATVTLTCSTTDLHRVLQAISHLTN